LLGLNDSQINIENPNSFENLSASNLDNLLGNEQFVNSDVNFISSPTETEPISLELNNQNILNDEESNPNSFARLDENDLNTESDGEIEGEDLEDIEGEVDEPEDLFGFLGDEFDDILEYFEGQNVSIDPELQERIGTTLSDLTNVLADLTTDLINPQGLPPNIGLPIAIGQCFIGREGIELVGFTLNAIVACALAGVGFGANLDNNDFLGISVDLDEINEDEDENINPQSSAVVFCLTGLAFLGTAISRYVECVQKRVGELGNDGSLQAPRFLELIRLSEEIDRINAEAQEILNFDGDGDGDD